MRRVRIAAGEMPPRGQALVDEAVAHDPQLVLVARPSGDIALLLAAAEADVVVVAMRFGDLPSIVERLVDEYPDVGVVCLDSEAERALVYRVRPDVTEVRDVTPTTVATAIRRAAETAA